jgi:hypothetical protein
VHSAVPGAEAQIDHGRLGRVVQEQPSGSAPGAGVPSNRSSPAIPQHHQFRAADPMVWPAA